MSKRTTWRVREVIEYEVTTETADEAYEKAKLCSMPLALRPPRVHGRTPPPRGTRMSVFRRRQKPPVVPQRIEELAELAEGYRELAPEMSEWARLVSGAAFANRVRGELVALERWASEQSAGNAFAEQVRYWALAHLARFDASRAQAEPDSRENVTTEPSGDPESDFS